MTCHNYDCHNKWLWIVFFVNLNFSSQNDSASPHDINVFFLRGGLTVKFDLNTAFRPTCFILQAKSTPDFWTAAWITCNLISCSSNSGFQASHYSHLLEASHAVQNVELLPALGEIHFTVNKIWVSEVNKRQVLKDQTPVRKKKRNIKQWSIIISRSCLCVYIKYTLD